MLGQILRPQVQPTGMALWALGGEEDPSGRIERSLAYLRRTLNQQTPTASLAWGLLGLAAHGERPEPVEEWLATATERTLARDRSRHKLALLALAGAEFSTV